MFFYIKIKEDSEVRTPCLPKQQFNRFILLYWGVINIDVDRNNMYTCRQEALFRISEMGRGYSKEDIKLLLSGLFAPYARFMGACKNIKICRTCKNGLVLVCCWSRVYCKTFTKMESLSLEGFL